MREVGTRMKAAAAAETARAEAQAKLPKLREAEATAAAILRHVTLTRDQLDQEAERAATRQNELEARINELKRDGEREATAISDAAEALERLGAEAQALNEQSPQSQDGGAALKEAEARAEAQLRQLESRLSELQGDAADLTARREQLERVVRTESERLTRLAGQIGEIDEETAALEEKRARATAEAGDPAAAVEAARTRLEQAEQAAEEATAPFRRRARASARRPSRCAMPNTRSSRWKRKSAPCKRCWRWTGPTCSRR